MTEQKRKEFEEIVKPVIKWIAENSHPHTKIIIDSNSAEIMEGIAAFTTNEYLID